MRRQRQLMRRWQWQQVRSGGYLWQWQKEMAVAAEAGKKRPRAENEAEQLRRAELMAEESGGSAPGSGEVHASAQSGAGSSSAHVSAQSEAGPSSAQASGEEHASVQGGGKKKTRSRRI